MAQTGIAAATVDELFAGAAQVYVGVVVGGRPHVTPELLATGDGRLWCLSAAVTKKVAVLRDDARVGFFASTPKGNVVGIGRAAALDPMSPASLLSPLNVARSAVGTARFVARNAAELTGAALDGVAGKLGRPLPPHRVVLSIEPTALATVRDGEAHAWGQWNAGVSAPTIDQNDTASVEDVVAPDHLKDLLDDGPAAVGWFAADGHPLVLPGDWVRASSSARIPSSLFVQSGAAGESPAAVTRDKWIGYGPTGKQGVMLRGHAVAGADGETVRAVLDVDRLTYWDGIKTASTSPTA